MTVPTDSDLAQDPSSTIDEARVPCDDDEEWLLNAEDECLSALQSGRPFDASERLTERPEMADALQRRLRLVAAMHRSAASAFEGATPGPESSVSDGQPHSEAASLNLPLTLGRFEIIGVAGRGAFGVVLKARDAVLQRTVAIKIPHERFFSTAADRERFLREARSAAGLRHPSIVAVHEVGEAAGQPYIVTDFVDGETLAELAGRQRLSAGQAAILVERLAMAVEVAHAGGVVHRDVKPGNVMIDRQGQPHITDFGLARLDAEGSTLTTDGQLIGTPAYMSPEQAVGHPDAVDARSDVYGLGVVLYELLTGELPFRGSSRMVLQQVLHEEPRPPRRLDDRIPRDLETICLKAMAKEPRRRYQTARELAEDLHRHAASVPILARRITSAERLVRWCRRNRSITGLLLAVGVLLAVIVGLSTWGYWREAALRTQSERRRERTEDFLGSLVSQADRYGSEQSHLRDVEWNVYRLSIKSAQRSLEVGDSAAALAELDRGIAGDNAVDWRGWEWLHLQGRSAAQDVFQDFAVEDGIDCCVHDPSGRSAALGTVAGDVLLWDWRQSAVTSRWQAERLPGSPLAWRGDGRRLATIGAEGRIDTWEVATQVRTASIPGPGLPIRALEWAGVDRLRAVGADGQTLRVYDLARDRVWNPGPFPQAPNMDIQAAGLNSRFGLFAVASGPDAITLIAPQNSRPIRSESVATGAVGTALAISPDGQRLASSGADHLVRLWDLSSGDLVVRLSEATSPVQSLGWSPDGHDLTAVTESGRLCRWRSHADSAPASGWTVRLQEATAAAIDQDRLLTRQACETIRRWAGTEGQDPADVRERLLALAASAEILRHQELLADAIAAHEQLLEFNAARLPADCVGGTSLIPQSALHIDSDAERLIQDADADPASKRAELERLLGLMFPYGTQESPIPWQARPSNSIGAIWQIPPIIVELARSIGELGRLRASWDQHPWADSLPMLALRAEAAAAVGDQTAADRLIAEMEAQEGYSPLPLWSEACLVGRLKRRLTSGGKGFGAFALTDADVGHYVERSPTEVRLHVPSNAGTLPRVGVVRREPMRGDFVVDLSFEINQLQPPAQVAGIYLQLDLLEGGEVVSLCRSLSRDIGDELVAYKSRVTGDAPFRAHMCRFPFEGRTGRLILARRGGVMHWLAAAEPGQEARLIHVESGADSDVGAIWLFTDYRPGTTQGAVDITCREMELWVEP